jgi:chromosome segregation ATPase
MIHIYKNQMKKIILFSMVTFFMLAALPAFSQTYKTVADTAALNAEYIKVSRDITDLKAKLEKAKSDQEDDTKKANDASSDAQSTASDATDKAAKAIDGSVKEARRAKREAKRSVRDAKDSRKAQGNLEDSNKKVSRLSAELEKKQERLKELDGMRAAISGIQQ